MGTKRYQKCKLKTSLTIFSCEVFPLFLQNEIGSDLFVFQGRAFTQPQTLTALNSLQSLITQNNFPTDVGSILSGGFDVEDLMELQASQAQMNAFSGVLDNMKSSLNGQSLGMYTKYGSSPVMKYGENGMPKLEDTIFGKQFSLFVSLITLACLSRLFGIPKFL